MKSVMWAALVAATAVTCASGASADQLVFQRTETVLPWGLFDSPFNHLAFGQGYEITIILPAAPSAYGASVQWIGNREEYYEAGGYNWAGSNNISMQFGIPLTLNGNTLTGTFTSPQDYTVYWPNGNIKTMYVGKVDLFDYYAQLDPSFGGADVYVTLTAVPEPAAWALMIAGFGLAGSALRRRGLSPARS